MVMQIKLVVVMATSFLGFDLQSRFQVLSPQPSFVVGRQKRESLGTRLVDRMPALSDDVTSNCLKRAKIDLCEKQNSE